MDLVPNLYVGYPVEVYPLAAWTVEARLDNFALEGLIDRIDGGTGSAEPRYIAHSA